MDALRPGRHRLIGRWRPVRFPFSLGGMDKHTLAGGSPTVELTAWQRNGHVWLCYTVYDPYVPGKRQTRRIRKVRLDVSQELSVGQLTLLTKRLVDFVMPKLGNTKPVPQGLPYQEIGEVAVRPVPPGGGEGGENSIPEISSVRPIPEQRKTGQNHFAPTPPGVQRVARNRSSGLDLAPGEVEVPLPLPE